MITDNIIISLNSHYGTKNNGSFLSNVFFPFKGILSDNQKVKKKYLTLLNAQIPVSFYIVNEYNYRLTLKDVGGGGTHNIDLDYGNYSGNTLITELTTKINAGYPHTVSITLSRSTGKLTFTFNGQTQFRSDQSTIKNIIGFDSNLTGTTFIMPYPLNLLGTKKLFINSQILNISSFDSVNTNKTNIIATIPIDQPFYNMVSYTSAIDTNQHELRLNILDGIDIQIYDEDNNFINFNNIDWNITLNLTLEREEQIKYSYNLLDAIEQMQPQEEQPQEVAPIKTIEDIQQEEAQQEPQLEQIAISHDVNEPETLSESIKQYSEALLTGSNNYSSKVIDIIKENGDNMITKMTLKRRPISNLFEKALNYSTFGEFEKANPYDKLFHLAVVLELDNGKSYTLEKNATISMAEPENKPDTEYKEVNYPTNSIISLNSLLEKTRKRMGRKYFLYDAKNNNCQDFLLNVFDANNLGGSDEREFIKQDTRKIFNSSPKYLKPMAKFITDMGGRVDNTKSFIYDLYKHKKDLNFLLK
jgi:hypothetical protein